MAKRKDKPPSWIPAAIELLLNCELSGNDKTIYLYLLWRQGQNATAWPSQKRIATDIGVALCTVRRSVKNLEGQGLIKVEGTRPEGRGHSYRYAVNDLTPQAGPKDFTQEPNEAWLANRERNQT